MLILYYANCNYVNCIQILYTMYFFLYSIEYSNKYSVVTIETNSRIIGKIGNVNATGLAETHGVGGTTFTDVKRTKR